MRSRLVALFFLGLLLLNFPILSLWSHELLVAGIPILFAYSFLAWAALILMIALVSESKKRGETTLRDGPEPSGATPTEGEGELR